MLWCQLLQPERWQLVFLAAPSLEFNFLSVSSEERKEKSPTNHVSACLWHQNIKGCRVQAHLRLFCTVTTWESSDKWSNGVKLHPHLYCTALLLTQGSSILSEHRCTSFTSFRFCTLTSSSCTQRHLTLFLILSRVENYRKAKRQQHVGIQASPWSTELWSALTLTHCMTLVGHFLSLNAYMGWIIYSLTLQRAWRSPEIHEHYSPPMQCIPSMCCAGSFQTHISCYTDEHIQIYLEEPSWMSQLLWF